MGHKILIIEDETVVLEAYRRVLEDEGLTVLTATTLLEALDLVEAHPDIALVAVDGCFPRAEGESPYPEPGRPCSGEKFIVNARFKGPIIACSSEESFNRRMRSAGATHVSVKGRALCALIRTLLGLPAAP